MFSGLLAVVVLDLEDRIFYVEVVNSPFRDRPHEKVLAQIATNIAIQYTGQL